MNPPPVDNAVCQPQPPSVTVLPEEPPAAKQAESNCQHERPTLAAVEANQETDLWWGAYSGWTMLPSFVISLLLTGGIVWFAFAATRQRAQTVILVAAGLVWLIQTARWSHRCLSFSYRLTNRRLFIDRGFLFPSRLQVLLEGIANVEVQQNRLERLLGIGRLRVRLHDSGHQVLELAGVSDPCAAAKTIEGARSGRHAGGQPT